MMEKISLALLFISNFSFAQNPLVKQWDYRYGGNYDENFTCFIQTLDKGFLIAGYSGSDSSGDKSESNWGAGDNWIIKIDSLENKQWDKDFGGIQDDQPYFVQQTKDRGYILGGLSFSDSSGNKTQPSWGESDYWIVKIDSLGNKEWDKRFGGYQWDELHCIKQTEDYGYILGGWSWSDISGNKTQSSWGGADYWIIKIDSLGVVQWDKRYGGGGDDFLYDLQLTNDEGYILGGYSNSGISGDKTQALWGVDDYWIIKIDSLGTVQWDKDYGGNGGDHLYSLKQTKDHGFILGGDSYSGISGDKTQAVWQSSTDFWMLKTDSLGIKQWDRDFGGNYNEEFKDIYQTFDGGYLLTGSSYSYMSGNKTENNLGDEQDWIVKTDSIGNFEWDKTMFTTGHDETGAAIQTIDGCYVAAIGTAADVGGYKTQYSRGGYDYWIIKFCDTTIATNLSLEQTDPSVSIYPNPSLGNFTIELLQSENSGETSIDVMNTLGQKIFSSHEKISSINWKKEIDLHEAASGIYFIEIKSSRLIGIVKKKIVITR